jgi:sulfate adenylyltransferase subunit 1
VNARSGFTALAQRRILVLGADGDGKSTLAARLHGIHLHNGFIAELAGHDSRNLLAATGSARIAIIVVDARQGVRAKTRGDILLARSLGVRRLIAAVNKMDLVGCEYEVFKTLRADLLAAAANQNFAALDFVPVIAPDGDMVTERGDRLDWYRGPVLEEMIESAADAAGALADAELLS